jgi:RHS repeat-associated protein
VVTDHLGGTALVVTGQTPVTEVSRLRYYPFGGRRTSYGASPTDKQYTGQQLESLNGNIYHYGARMYHADIGRFISADTIVPEPGNPQALNRYSYVINNPMRYNDPTGHCYGEAPVPCPADWTFDDYVENAPPCCSGGPIVSERPCNQYAPCPADASAYNHEQVWHMAYCSGSIGGGSAAYGAAVGYGCNPAGSYEAGVMFISIVGINFAFSSSDVALAALLRQADALAVGMSSGTGTKPISFVTGPKTRVAPPNLVQHFKDGVVDEVVLGQDLAVRRAFGGGARPRGNWWTTNNVSGQTSARSGLALPNANLATNVVEGVIPKGTTVYVGQAAGGWQQIYVQNQQSVILGGSRPLR